MRMLSVGLALLVVGCSSTPSPFLGVWQITAGTETVSCTTQVSTTLTGTLTIIQGNDSSTIQVANSAIPCSETFSTSGDKATIPNAQNCPIQANRQAATLTFANDQLTFNGGTLSELGNGTITTGTGASASTCSFETLITAKMSN